MRTIIAKVKKKRRRQDNDDDDDDDDDEGAGKFFLVDAPLDMSVNVR